MEQQLDLLVDIGNSHLKWAWSGAGIWQTGAVPTRGIALSLLLEQTWGADPAPRRLLVSNVRGRESLQGLQAWVERRWGSPLVVFESQPRTLDVTNRYRDPTALGSDRWAALVGTRGITHASAGIVDCGTALTLDVLSADGEFMGGMIFPGLTLLRDALMRGTHAVKADGGNDAYCLARETADGVAAGSLYGLAGAVDRMVQECEQAMGETLQLFVTGGDADKVAARMQHPLRRVPDLVLRGLARVAAEQ